MKRTGGLKKTSTLKAKKPLRKVSKRPSKQVQPTVSKLKKEADKWHSKATRLRFADNKDGEWFVKCFTCPNYKPTKQMQCGHFMSRQYNSTRYHEHNTAPQCYGCNVMHQGRQYEFAKQLDLMYGDGTADKMYQLSKQGHQFTEEQLKVIIERSKEEVASYA